MGKHVVLDLSRRLQGLRYHLYFDNFFSSVALAGLSLNRHTRAPRPPFPARPR